MILLLILSLFLQTFPSPGPTHAPTTGGGSTPWVTSVTLGALRNNFTGTVGVSWNANSAIMVTQLGRWNVAGNTGMHNVYLVHDVAGGPVLQQCVIDTTMGTPGTFQYCSITPTVLVNGDPYVVFSEELSGGDQWYNDDGSTTNATVTAAATASNSVFGVCALGMCSVTAFSAPPRTFGPVNFQNM